MPLTTLIPALASIAAVLVGLTIATYDLSRWRGAWRAPAAASALFLLFSLVTIAREGPIGFWALHTHNLWGNQVWIDLLLAVSVAFAGLAPRARALGMRPLRWFILILATGSVGVLALAARILHLGERAPRGTLRG